MNIQGFLPSKITSKKTPNKHQNPFVLVQNSPLSIKQTFSIFQQLNSFSSQLSLRSFLYFESLEMQLWSTSHFE